MARVCVPMDGEVDRARLGYRPADLPARLRLVADAYGLDRDGRAELLTTMEVAFARIEAAIRRSVDAGNPNAKALWDLSEMGLDYVSRTIRETGMPGVEPVAGWLKVSKVDNVEEVRADLSRTTSAVTKPGLSLTAAAGADSLPRTTAWSVSESRVATNS